MEVLLGKIQTHYKIMDSRMNFAHDKKDLLFEVLFMSRFIFLSLLLVGQSKAQDVPHGSQYNIKSVIANVLENVSNEKLHELSKKIFKFIEKHPELTQEFIKIFFDSSSDSDSPNKRQSNAAQSKALDPEGDDEDEEKSQQRLASPCAQNPSAPEETMAASKNREKFIADFHFTLGNPNSKAKLILIVHPIQPEARALLRTLFPILLKYIKNNPDILSLTFVDRSTGPSNRNDALRLSSWIWSQPKEKEAFISALLTSDEDFRALLAQSKENPEIIKKIEKFEEQRGKMRSSPLHNNVPLVILKIDVQEEINKGSEHNEKQSNFRFASSNPSAQEILELLTKTFKDFGLPAFEA